MPLARSLLIVETAFAVAFSARTLILGPPRFWVSALAASVYGATIVFGVLVLSLRMFADAVLRGPEGARGVALTFEPDPK